METNQLKFRIELNVLKHLGIGLYSSTPAVVTEIIANAWDADAHQVTITLDPERDLITVQDDGHGMAHADVQDKFLAVGYARRANNPLSQSGQRRVMGRKGIGKLAMFSLAKYITIVTKAANSAAVAFAVDVDELLQATQANKEVADFALKSIEVPSDFALEHGTRITLTRLNNKIHKSETFLRPRLARRFGVFSDQFQVELNGRAINRADAGYYGDLQFLWCFDQQTRALVEPLATALAHVPQADGSPGEKCVADVPSEVLFERPEPTEGGGSLPVLQVGGFIATVDKPAKLGKGDDSLNRLAVFANGRLFQEDILPELGDAKYFNSYLVGEIHADFLDSDEHDRATASRESIRHDDELFLALRRHLGQVFSQISTQWDAWRTAQGYGNTPNKNLEIEAWIESFKDGRDRKAADRLMTSIGKLNLSNDEAADLSAKNMLYRSAVVGFEKLRARSQLDRLDSVTDVLSPDFQAIFASLDEIEASYYLDIVRGRLDVISKFETEIVDEKKQERVAQNYLFDHLWLLDPSWDRVTGSEQWEFTLTNELKRACPDAEEGARLDIGYRTTAGRHVIIELKRPGLKVKADDLQDQGVKYIRAMKQYYRENPNFGGLNGRLPAIDVFFLVSTRPQTDADQERVFDAYNMRFLTYDGLINNAKLAYASYLSVHQQTDSRLVQLLESLQG